ncbi:MAG: RNA polymerase sigma factor [Patescibacteria group bacterium]
MKHKEQALTDEQLAKLVQAGQTEAFGDLVVRYEDKLKRYARRFLFQLEDQEDLVQTVFLKVFENIQGFNTDKRFSPWIYRIAHNEFISTLRKRKFEPLPFFDPDTLFPHPVAKEKTDADTLLGEQKEVVEKALKDLKPQYREVVILYYFEDFDYKAIGDILRIPTSTVGVRLKRAKEKLVTILENNNYTV